MIVIFLLVLALYLPCVSPTIYGGDSGELTASAHLLGIPHAPGYPTYNLLAKCAQVFIPFGNIAYRTNALSAILAGITLALLGTLFLKIFSSSRSRFITSVGLALLALSPIFLEQSASAEVFLLNAVFAIGIGLCLVESRRAASFFVLASFLFGLGMGNHHTLLFITPAFLLVNPKLLKNSKVLIGSALFFILGLTIYLYLPIRARMSPAVNFGDPETFSRFWAVVTRKEFGALSLHPAAVPFRDVPLLLKHAAEFWQRTLNQVGSVAVLIAVLGCFETLFSKNNRLRSTLALLAWLILGLGFDVLSNLSPGSSIGQWRLERFFLLPLFFLLFLVVQGLVSLIESGGWKKYFAIVLILGLVVQKGMAFQELSNIKNNHVFRDFAISTLRAAPPQSLFFIDRILFDEPTSAFLNYTQVEQRRPDIEFYYRPGTLFKPVYGTDILDLSWDERFARQAEIEKKVLEHPTGPLSFFGFEKHNAPFSDPVLKGLLYHPKKSASQPNPFFISNRQDVLPTDDYQTRHMAVHFAYFFGKEALEKGDIPLAQRWFNKATWIGWDMAWLYSNLGGLWAAAGKFDLSQSCYVRSLELDPYFSPAYFGLGFTEIKLNHQPEAIVAYKQAIKMDPHNAEAYYMCGVALFYSGDKLGAKEYWERYIELDPKGPYVPSVKKVMAEIAYNPLPWK